MAQTALRGVVTSFSQGVTIPRNTICYNGAFKQNYKEFFFFK